MSVVEPGPKKPGGSLIFQRSVCGLLASESVWEKLAGGGGDELLRFSPADHFVAVALIRGGVGIWELDPIPVLAAVLPLPSRLQREDESARDVEVVGLSWSSDARKLLVTYEENTKDTRDCYICLWDVMTLTAQGCYPLVTSCGAQLFPLDPSSCVFCTGSTELVVMDLTSGETKQYPAVPTSQEEGEEAAVVTTGVERRTAQKTRGICVFSRDGRWLYCLQGRTLVKRDSASMEVLVKCPDDPINHQSGLVHMIDISFNNRILLVGAARGAYVFDADSLEYLCSLGGSPAIKMGWGSWTMGPDCNDVERQQILIIGVPPIVGSDLLGNEGLFIWTMSDEVGAAPEIIPTAQDGIKFLSMARTKAAMIALSPEGALLLRRETFITDFPGAMYPSGYTLIEHNLPYLEGEDELDNPVRPPCGSQEEASSTAMEVEDEVMDVETVSDDDESDEAFLEKKIWLPLTIGPKLPTNNVDMEEDKSDDEGEEGGVPGLFPMPKTLCNRKKVKAAKEGPCKRRGQKSTDNGAEPPPSETGNGEGPQPPAAAASQQPEEEVKILTPMQRGRQRMLDTLAEELARGCPPLSQLLPPALTELPPLPLEGEAATAPPLKKPKKRPMLEGGLSSGPASSTSSNVSSPRGPPLSTHRDGRPHPTNPSSSSSSPSTKTGPSVGTAASSASSLSNPLAAASSALPLDIAPEAHESALSLLGLTAALTKKMETPMVPSREAPIGPPASRNPAKNPSVPRSAYPYTTKAPPTTSNTNPHQQNPYYAQVDHGSRGNPYWAQPQIHTRNKQHHYRPPPSDD